MSKTRLQIRAGLEDWAYIAGLFDGEGSIGICKSKGSKGSFTTLRIANNDLVVLHWLLDITGVGRIYALKIRGSRKQPYEWTVRPLVDIYFVIENILPHIKVKLEKTLIVKRFIESRLNSLEDNCCAKLTLEQVDIMEELNG